MISSLFILAAAAGSMPASPATAALPVTVTGGTVVVTEPNPKKMSQREIREFNVKLSVNHPYFIRCVKSAEIGSLIQRNFSCRTNQQWAAADEGGNREARDIADRMSGKAVNSN